MLIKYKHISDAKTEKIFDTKKAYKNFAFARHDPQTKLYNKTQKEFNKIYLDIFKRDKARGIVLSYKIVEDSEK